MKDSSELDRTFRYNTRLKIYYHGSNFNHFIVGQKRKKRNADKMRFLKCLLPNCILSLVGPDSSGHLSHIIGLVGWC